ncbi:MAG: hypothetical protein ACTSWX_06960 [Promethearchaeota archaeon]
MSSTVLVSIISGLEGRVGSNPKIIKIYPDNLDATEEFILEKSLPHGALPDQFFQDKLDSRNILVYTFEIEKDGRNDLASIGLVLDKDVIIENLQPIIKCLINRLNSENLLTYEIFQESLPKIIDGLNKKSKIKIGKMIFDVNSILNEEKLELKQKTRKARGMF